MKHEDQKFHFESILDVIKYLLLLILLFYYLIQQHA